MRLVEKVGVALTAPEAPPRGSGVVVGVSGGVDSTVLLHLLRFPLHGLFRPVVAHFDHAWRRESDADAAWVRGLCRAWGIPVHVGRAHVPPASEDEARRARYDFFARVAFETGASSVMTAHHADDQAETILFRVLRGTGLRGLAGMPQTRGDGIFRPLLGVWRSELEGYARDVGLRWRHDPTNDDLAFARNTVRHTLLPEAERIAPGAREALVRLGRIASIEEEAWESLTEALLPGLGLHREGEEVAFDARAWAAWPAPVRARLLRALARRVGVTLDESTTRRAERFGVVGSSGAAVQLGGGVELHRSFDRLILVRRGEEETDDTLQIPGPGEGSGAVRLGGRRLTVWWGADATATHGSYEGSGAEAPRARFGGLHYPLVVRGRLPGDRIRLRSGTKTLKKLLIEARVPAHRRSAQPIVVDGRGVVLWVPGVARALDGTHGAGGEALTIGIG